MVMMPIEEFQGFLASMLETTRTKPESVARAVTCNLLEILYGHLNSAKKKGELDMAKLSSDIKVVITTMTELPARQREGVWPNVVQEQAQKLKELTDKWKADKGDPAKKPALNFSGNDISVSHLSAVVSRLKKRGTIPDSVQLVKRKENIFMIMK